VVGEGDKLVAAPIVVDNQVYEMTCVSMGNPHAVVFMDGVDDLKIEEIGPKFEQHRAFSGSREYRICGTNGSQKSENARLGAWIRRNHGLRNRTPAATAVAAILNGCAEREVTVHLLGGDLEIQWDETDNCVYMTRRGGRSAFDRRI